MCCATSAASSSRCELILLATETLAEKIFGNKLSSVVAVLIFLKERIQRGVGPQVKIWPRFSEASKLKEVGPLRIPESDTDLCNLYAW